MSLADSVDFTLRKPYNRKMFGALALAFCLQAKPHLTIKQIWAAGRRVEADGGTLEFSPYGYWKTPTTLVQWARNSDGFCISTFNASNGEFQMSDTVNVDVDGLPSDLSKYRFEGRYAIWTDDRTHVETYVDIADLQPKFQLIYSRVPIDEAALAKVVLTKRFLSLKAVGFSCLLWDSPTSRILETDNGVLSYKPGTWVSEGTLVPKNSLPGPGATIFGAADLEGNPDTGPFAIQNGQPDYTRAYYFDKDWNSLKVDPSIFCYDAGPMGFLTRHNRTRAEDHQGLVCLDPRTGAALWTRKDILPSGCPIRWVGNYAIGCTMTEHPVTPPTRNLLILDAKTGETLGQVPIPHSITTMLWVEGDMMIFQDQGFRYYGYVIVKG